MREPSDPSATTRTYGGAPPAGEKAPADPRPRSPDGARDRYELGEEIARGGMGAIYRVRDRSLDRELAVKVVLAGQKDNAEVLLRFQAEARITGQLQHPGVVPVHDFGVLPDGRPFLAMKLVRGRNLAQLVKERPDPGHDLPRFLKIFEQVCQAVAYAHGQRVIHRDLKPLNVMVGAFGEVQVMDWGLAKRLPPHGQSDTEKAAGGEDAIQGEERATVTWHGQAPAEQQTRAGSVMGTPVCMPPEQARGEIDRIDERADVFGLGAMLCELLTGRPPYTGKLKEVLAKAAAADLAEAYSRLDASATDPELIAVAKCCLAAKPEDRFRDAGEVAAAVAAYQSGMQEKLRVADLERASALAKEAEAQARARAERKARLRTVGLAAAVLLLVVGGGAAGFFLYRQAAEKEAEQARQKGEARVAVGAALDQAETWLKEGRSRETDAALVQAEKRLDEAKDEELRRRLDRDRKDLAFVKSVETQVIGGGRGPEFRRAFKEYGLDVAQMDPDKFARAVQDSPIRERLLDGLDGWLWGWTEPETDEVKRTLLQILRGVDPDPLRSNIREALVARDGARLRDLVNTADVDSWPPFFAAHVGDSRLLSHDDAIRLLKAAQMRHPDYFILPYAIGYRAWESKPPRDEEAVAYFRIAISIKPDIPSSWIMMDACLERMGDGAGALTFLHRGVECNPDEPYFRALLANALLRQQRVEEAVAVCQEAIALAPKDPEDPGAKTYAQALNMIAPVLAKAGKREEAETELRRAIQLKDDDHVTHVILGHLLEDAGRLNEAEKEFRRAIQLKEDFAAAHNDLGALLTRQGKREEAEDEYRRAMQLDNDPTPHYNLGLHLAEKGRAEEAEQEYRRAIQIQDDYAAAHNALAILLAREGKREEAEKEYRLALRIQENFADAHDNLGALLYGESRWEEAEKEFRRALQLREDDATSHNNLAAVLKVEGKREEAEKEFRRAIQIQDDYVLAHRSLGNLLTDEGRRDEAEKEYRRAIELKDNYADAHYYLGALLATEGKVEEAEKEYRRTIQIKDDFAAAHYDLGVLLAGKGEVDEAEREYRRAIQSKEDIPDAHNNLGLVLAARGKLDEAEKEYRRAIQIKDDFALAHNNLGLVLKTQGKAEEAEMEYRRAIQIQDDFALAHVNLGLLLLDRRDTKAALADLRRAQELNPADAETKRRLAEGLAAAKDLDPDYQAAFDAWKQETAQLPPEKQVEAVAKKLQELNPEFDGKATPTIENGVVTALKFVSDHVTRLSPVQALTGLQTLWCNGSAQGKGRLVDLSPLKDMKLTEVNFADTKVSDLSLLKDMKLTSVACFRTPLSDLSPLKGMPLAYLDCGGTKVSDLTPLKDSQIRWLICPGTPVSDLSPLTGMQLNEIYLDRTQVRDLAPLAGMPLKKLSCDFKPDRDTEILGSFNTLETINGKPAAEFWKKAVELDPRSAVANRQLGRALHDNKDLDGAARSFRAALELDPADAAAHAHLGLVLLDQRDTKAALKEFRKAQELNPADAETQRLLAEAVAAAKELDPDYRAALDAWRQETAKLPPEKQVEAVAKKLQELNPEFDGKVAPTIENGVVTRLDFVSDHVTRLSPVQALPALKHLACGGSDWGKSRLTDLSPLKGMKLTEFQCSVTPVSDLSALEGMLLTSLDCFGTRVTDLSPLKGMPLTFLTCAGTPVSDLSPLKDMKLTTLWFNGTSVSDLSPLKDMPLTNLIFYGTKVSDLSPLKGMPLAHIECDFKPEPRRRHPALHQVAGVDQPQTGGAVLERGGRRDARKDTLTEHKYAIRGHDPCRPVRRFPAARINAGGCSPLPRRAPPAGTGRAGQASTVRSAIAIVFAAAAGRRAAASPWAAAACAARAFAGRRHSPPARLRPGSDSRPPPGPRPTGNRGRDTESAPPPGTAPRRNTDRASPESCRSAAPSPPARRCTPATPPPPRRRRCPSR